ncbi:Pyridine nucleotide-disulphide oxidoreductase [Desulfotomaculum arcticum]|uniref:Pyridine nucleotide-disulphide oxidoreductase n=1 Tax=Desulfotruncus arcticus DSM 17038 TaxID=1121424 RepID=A0A1I2N396_9FIRM|nr:FAD-dependent oxidoreductase [Desulfotruncus arcticus]SFF98232.1 Pyridine nucleotide-disulphide oxidoreductase [Desulfotomaculum arcticum] [Desulfotruncus arcticus DSM 17038]
MGNYDYLIIGNSAGAVGCIEGLRSIDKTGSIGLVSEENHHVYSRALIPYYLAGKITKDKMFYRPAGFYEQAGVNLITGQKAEAIDTEKQEVVLTGGDRLSYGKLLLATGGKPIYPPIAGLDKQNVYSFHSFNDLLGIEKKLATARHAVVLGGGVIGLMAAEVLKKRNLKVSVVELGSRVLAPVIDETGSMLVQNTFKNAGVGIYLNNTIQEVQGNEFVEGIILKDGTSIPCDLLIVGVGVIPRVELAENAGIEVNRGIVVNKKMRTSAPNVYACGDCAANYNFVTGQTQPLPLWPNAYAGGRTSAFNMAGVKREYTDSTSMNAMHFFDLNMINAGLNVTGETAGDFRVLQRLDADESIYLKFILNNEGIIQGYILIGQINRVGIFLNLMRKKIDVRNFEQDLLSGDFGYANLPDELRWQLLREDVILGVV